MAKYIAEITTIEDKGKYLTPIKKIGTYNYEDFNSELFGKYRGIRLRGKYFDILDLNCLYTFEIEDESLLSTDNSILTNNTEEINNKEEVVGKNLYILPPPKDWGMTNIKLKTYKEKYYYKHSEVCQIPDYVVLDKIYDYVNNIELKHTPITNTLYLTNSLSVLGPFSWECVSKDDSIYKLIPHNSVDYMTDTYNFVDFQPFLSNILTKDNENYTLIFNRTKRENITPMSQQDCIPMDSIIDTFFLNTPTKTLTEAAIKTYSISEDRRKRLFETLHKQNITSNQVQSFVQEFAKNQDLIEELKNYVNIDDIFISKTTDTNLQDATDKITCLEEKIKDLEEEKNKLEEDSNIQTKINNELKEQFKNSLQNEELKVENDRLEKRQIELENSVKKLEEENERLTADKTRLSDATDKIIADFDSNLRNKFDSLQNKAIDNTIDTQILGKILQVASHQNRNNITSNIISHKYIENNENYQIYTSPKKLLDHLYDNFKPIRKKYTKNDIANILLCISLGFLTIFAGEPGTGKTSFVKYLAKFLGLTGNKNANGTDIKRYIEIAVEKGWTSKKDLLGFYNPLTKDFNTNNQELYNSILQLQKESKENIEDFPFFILLDEANLSPMEYYWADFMKVCDYQNIEQCKINLYEGFDFIIPKYLRFLATINLDHTTEILSPRLIDRSWIIKLPNPNYSFEEYLNTDNSSILDKYPLIYTDVLKKIIDTTMNKNDINTNISKTLEDIIKNFNTINIKFSPRIMTMILKYCIAADKLELMNTKDNELTALDYAVAQKILPMIDGQGEQFKKLITNLKDIMTEEKMPKCHEILIDIERKAENNGMEYYQFFAR